MATTTTTYADAAAENSFDKILFIKEMGAELNGFLWGIGADGYEFEDVDGNTLTIREATTPAEEAQNLDLTRKLIETQTPAETLDAMAKASPETAKLVEAIKANPGLADAFHKAIVADPTMLVGLQKMATNNGTGDLSMDDLASAFTNPLKKAFAVPAFTQALNQIATTSLEFDHLYETGNRLKNEIGDKGFSEILRMLREDPDALIASLLTGTGMEGTEMGDFLAGFLKNFAPVLAMFIDPNGPMLKPYVDLGKNLYGRSVATGREMRLEPSSVNDDAYIEYPFSENEFIAEVTALHQDGSSAILASEENFVQALAMVNPTATREMSLVAQALDTDPDLKAAVSQLLVPGDITASATNLMQVEKFMVRGASPKNAFLSVANGKDFKEFFDEKEVRLEAEKEAEIQAVSNAPSAVTDFADATFVQQLQTGLVKAFNDNGGTNPTSEQIVEVWKGIDPAAAEELQAMIDNGELKGTFAKFSDMEIGEALDKINQVQNNMENDMSPKLSLEAVMP